MAETGVVEECSDPSNMAALRAAKNALRANLKKRIAALGEQEKLRQSDVVTRMLMVHPKYQSCQRIAVFLSMPDEIGTEKIIDDIFQKGKACFIPKYQSKSNHMDMVRLATAREIRSLPLTTWNIHQPSEDDEREDALATAGGSGVTGTENSLPLNLKLYCTLIDDNCQWKSPQSGGLDLILMPGLGFDKNGNRLGRGKGYYDSFLERCLKHPKGKPYTIALAFKEQVCEEIPVTENDIQINEILYECGFK
ncbi:5,10-methenyltetrahydrofolate synthetase (5-formyltetrahydrofolate cyclo-ligase) isoform X1 [Polypterus senegalus]|uniref:5,10-methenyltetrahydrofolate synthetase (5-formyltetrahydrofolate cyclo-ligase) isoform X1 n=1 Tax=Polypterus senegalus TaxID=55291 RepID=UPI0019635903|nr:5,10-methenyltetrahydrofolate synthetase (5-formyltetrahydrofolate cyclo-ligase) isoform X1 [Polypterus senegalus]